MEADFDTIVLGLGAMGSAAAYQLAKRGNKVLGIDQFSPPHSYGSSHGDSRLTRQAIGEGSQYTPLSLRSYELWREIEKETGKKFLNITGGLIISQTTGTGAHHGVENFFDNTIAAAKQYGIRHDILDAPAIRKRFPQFDIKDDEIGYYEYNAGFVEPEECIAATLSLALKYGAKFHVNEKVKSFTEENGVVSVITDKGKYSAKKLIVSAGAWVPQLLGEEYSPLFSICRQVMYWFDIKNGSGQFSPGKFPVFIWRLQGEEQGIYGFPAMDGVAGGVKIATNQYKVTTTADEVERDVSEQEIQQMYERYVRPYFPGLTGKSIRAIACLYTVTPDFGFIIDRHPKYPSIIIASPCSGHGFKHSAAIGEVLSQIIIDGKSKIDIEDFKINRFL
jgi:sarcosine oxidase